MSTLDVWKSGRDKSGWACSQCPRLFDHGDRRRRTTFLRLVAHKVIRHHRVPTGVVGNTRIDTWTLKATTITSRTDGAS